MLDDREAPAAGPDRRGNQTGRAARGTDMRFVDYLKGNGYRLFRGTVDASVYSFFQCRTPRKAVWYFRVGSYQCAGCREQCETDSSAGFQMFLDF